MVPCPTAECDLLHAATDAYKAPGSDQRGAATDTTSTGVAGQSPRKKATGKVNTPKRTRQPMKKRRIVSKNERNPRPKRTAAKKRPTPKRTTVTKAKGSHRIEK